ncbi:hypothetical protein [Pedobacter sp.]
MNFVNLVDKNLNIFTGTFAIVKNNILLCGVQNTPTIQQCTLTIQLLPQLLLPAAKLSGATLCNIEKR